MMIRLGWMGAGVLVIATAVGCGDDQKGKANAATGAAGGAGAGAGGATEAGALATPPVGVVAIKALNYTYGKGAAGHKRAVAGYKAHNWAEVKAGCEDAIAKDKDHLEAHRVLASALAQEQKYDQVSEHLLIALAADWLRFGPKLEQDTDLAAFFASPQGAALKAASARLKDDFFARAARGVWVLGRRSTFKQPKPGVQSSSTRGELYSYDLETKRYLRLTHTNHEVAGWMRSPSGDEIILVGYQKVQQPKADAAEIEAPTFKKAWVEALDPATLATKSKRATFDSGRALEVQYGTGGQLLVTSYNQSAGGRWDLDAPVRKVVDRTTGKATKTKASPIAAPALTMTPEDVTFVGVAADGITASWDSVPARSTSLTLTATSKAITLPEDEPAVQDGLAWSPSKGRLAIVGYGDRCADDKQSIYTVDAATGKLTHVLTADSHFNPVWADDDHLVYEDGTGSLRIHDVAAGKELAKLGDRAGLALRGLGVTAAPICKMGWDSEDAEDFEDEGSYEGMTDEEEAAIAEQDPERPGNFMSDEELAGDSAESGGKND